MAKNRNGPINGVDYDWFGSCDDDAVLNRYIDAFVRMTCGATL